MQIKCSKCDFFTRTIKVPPELALELHVAPISPLEKKKKKKADLLPPEICKEDLQAINEVVQNMHPIEITVNRINKK